MIGKTEENMNVRRFGGFGKLKFELKNFYMHTKQSLTILELSLFLLDGTCENSYFPLNSLARSVPPPGFAIIALEIYN